MTVYNRLWMWTAGLLGGLGVFETFLVARTAASAWFALLTGILVGLGYRCMRSEDRRPSVGRVAAIACLAAVAAVASIGLYLLLGDGLFLLVLVAVSATSPVVVRRALSQARKASQWLRADDQTPPTPPQRDSAGPFQVVTLPATPAFDHSGQAAATMHTAALCSAWRSSSAVLERLTASGAVVEQRRLVEVRQQYLDELERRDPLGFQRWLHSGARPSSDPSAYLGADDERPGGIFHE